MMIPPFQTGISAGAASPWGGGEQAATAGMLRCEYYGTFVLIGCN